jgi:NAD(P)H-flavin reductase
MKAAAELIHKWPAVSSNPWQSQTVRIEKITPEIPDVATYELAFTDPQIAAGYQFVPGQFNMLYLPGVGEVAISVSANPQSRDTWAHTIRVAGSVTQSLSRLAPGATLGLRGPFGNPWPVDVCHGHDVVLVAGGIGLAPLRPVIYQLLANRARYGNLTLLAGARTPEGLLYPREYEDWQKAGFDVQSSVDRASTVWTGNVGVVTLLLDRLGLPRPERTVVLTCGPEVMMHFAVKSALRRGIPEEQIWLSSERNMQCAVGLCGHCQLGPTFVCKDGPVFRHDQIAPFLKIEGL